MAAPRREIVIICGPMFSGKSTALLTRYNRARHAKHKVLCFNPETNVRDADIKSRDGLSAACVRIPATNPEKILELASEVDVVMIDEAQFFADTIVTVVEQLYASGKRVVLACLDTDLLGRPFGPVPKLLALPEAEVERVRSVCEHCKHDNATRTDLKDKALREAFRRGDNPILTGDAELYQALCYDCYRTLNPDDFKKDIQSKNEHITQQS